jgi:hypothetical protein
MAFGAFPMLSLEGELNRVSALRRKCDVRQIHKGINDILLLGTFIETLVWGFLSAGLQNNPTERKCSHVSSDVTQRIMQTLGYSNDI